MGTPVAPGNRGVMALGASLACLCRSGQGNPPVAFLLVHRPAADVLVRMNDGDFKIPVVTCRMSPSAKLREHLLWILLMAGLYRLIPISGLRSKIRHSIPWIDTVLGADLVGDVRGGDSFSDIYGLSRFISAFLPVLSVILLRGRIAHFPQTYGPFRSRTARRLAQFVLCRSSSLFARDPVSQSIAQELVGGSIEVGLSPDVAFSLHPVRPRGIETAPPLRVRCLGIW